MSRAERERGDGCRRAHLLHEIDLAQHAVKGGALSHPLPLEHGAAQHLAASGVGASGVGASCRIRHEQSVASRDAVGGQ